MREPQSENSQLKPLHEIATALRGIYGRTVNYSTLYRWVTRGIRGRKLKATAIGARWYCDLDSVASFISTISMPSPRTSEAEVVA